MQTTVQQWLIAEEEADQRIDNFLFARFRHVPKSRIYRALRKGEVRVNKKRIKAPYRLQAGDNLRIPPLHVPDKAPDVKASASLSALLKQRILYEDDALLVINKPSGIAVHGGSGISLGVIEALRQLYPQHRQMDLVHRLDRDTSGCLMIAKKRSALRDMHAKFREQQVQKRYYCLCSGRWRGDKQVVKLPLKKNQLSSGERIVRVDAEDGKPSQTTFTVIQRFTTATLMQADLQTGRTHQIRVHATASRHPIAGDAKYGDRAFNKAMQQMGLPRLFLHAHQLCFTPLAGDERICVDAPLDDDLQAVVEQLQEKSLL